MYTVGSGAQGRSFLLRKAIEYSPNYHDAYYHKACCHALMGDVIEAVDCLSRAIGLDPKYRELARTDSDFDATRDED